MQSTHLKQLYTEEIVCHSRNGTTITYRLNTVTQDDKKIKLVSGIDAKDTALLTFSLSAPLYLAGILKIIYDLLLWRTFRHIRPPEEQ